MAKLSLPTPFLLVQVGQSKVYCIDPKEEWPKQLGYCKEQIVTGKMIQEEK